MLFITRTEFYKELNRVKAELRADFNHKSNIDIANPLANAEDIEENKEGTLDLADVTADSFEAVDDVAEVVADLYEAVEELGDVVANVVESLED